MKEVVKSIGQGFAGLVRFSGRDSRARFWHYAAFILIAGQLIGLAVLAPALGRIQRFAAEHPDQARVSTGPGHYSIRIHGEAPELGSLVADMFTIAAIVSALVAALLAAAVARRLHDLDRRGYWGLAPLPFLAGAIVLMPRVMAGFGAEGDPDWAPFLGLIASNLGYLYALALLVYLLVGKGTPGPNRFGPPPG